MFMATVASLVCLLKATTTPMQAAPQITSHQWKVCEIFQESFVSLFQNYPYWLEPHIVLQNSSFCKMLHNRNLSLLSVSVV
ncbi:hypothetical protein SETIT_2G049900v2 [Setaria italica]|uniref:Secreted protein n=1 Tax=Setaria italica TaxID=4555 RepID=A0A368PVQ9_SETIT|nr:hypothetical protein SETIT_2G049900v2 [Setaria italica]